MTSNDQYKLERDEVETERLNEQHRLLVRAVGYLLHPRITKCIVKDDRRLQVAELASGTGAFLIDLAGSVPSSWSLHGYDISSDSFTPSSSLPKNVKLSVSNAKQPPPPELEGIYDVVCIRFLNIALSPSDWPVIARNVLSMLRPGGALQWIEADFRQCMQPLYTTPGSSTAALARFMTQFLAPLPQCSWMTSNLEPTLEDVGFHDIKHDVSSVDRLPEDRQTLSRSWVRAARGGLRHHMKLGVPSGPRDEEELEQGYKGAIDNIAGGAYVRADMHVFTAFKP